MKRSEVDREILDAAGALVELFEKSSVRHGSDYTYDTITVKRWNLGDGGATGNCPDCEDNAEQDWIPEDESFESGHDEPPAHPHCDCALETKERRIRVYD